MSTPPDPYNAPGDENPNDLPSFQPGSGADEAPEPAAKPEPPSSIINAARLMFVGAGLAVLGVISTLLTTDGIRDQIAETEPDMSADEIDTMASSTVASGVIFGVIAVGLWIWMAQTNRRGLSWARIVATVLGGVNILYTLAILVLFPSTGLSALVSLVTIGLAAVIIWLLFRPESTQYYNAVSEYRHQYGR